MTVDVYRIEAAARVTAPELRAFRQFVIYRRENVPEGEDTPWPITVKVQRHISRDELQAALREMADALALNKQVQVSDSLVPRL